MKLERKTQRLIDTYLDEAIPMEDLKLPQTATLAKIADANRPIVACQQNIELARRHLELVILLLGNAGRLFREAMSEQKVTQRSGLRTHRDRPQWVRQPVPGPRDPEMSGELAEPVTTVTGLARLGTKGEAHDRAGRVATEAEAGPNLNDARRNPRGLALAGGFNMTYCAVSVTRGWNKTAWDHVTNILQSAAETPSANRT